MESMDEQHSRRVPSEQDREWFPNADYQSEQQGQEPPQEKEEDLGTAWEIEAGEEWEQQG